MRNHSYRQVVLSFAEEIQRDVCAKHGVGLHYALEISSLDELFAVLDRNRGDKFAHGSIHVCARAIVCMNSGTQHLELAVIGTRENIANVIGGGFVDLGDIVLVGDRINTDWHEDALDFVACSMRDHGGFVVLVGVDELEKKLEMLRIVLM
jgi:hypothetical protein